MSYVLNSYLLTYLLILLSSTSPHSQCADK